MHSFTKSLSALLTIHLHSAFILVCRFLRYPYYMPQCPPSRYARGGYEHDDIAAEVADPACTEESCVSSRTPLDLPLARRSWIDADYTDETLNPKVRNGVKMGEGDGTVSLLSLGAMCVEGWKRPRWNPGGIKVTTVEVELFFFLEIK
jgi:hypothetical protein